MRPAMRTLAVTFALLASALVGAACGSASTRSNAVASYTVALDIVDETGRPVGGADFLAGSKRYRSAADSIVIKASQPIAGVVSVPGYLPEPVVVSRELGRRLRVRVFRERGPSGAPRVALHFGGDVMFGRRYVTPVRRDTAVLKVGDGGRSARAIVSDIAQLVAAADVASVNLESVVGSAPVSAAYPGKRFLLQSPVESMSALSELGVDLVTLGNNHANDWEDRGVTSTLEALRGASIPFTGAGLTDSEARRPTTLERRGLRIGTLSYTTVTGSPVNDALPTSSDTMPATVPPSDRWAYMKRPIQIGSVGQRAYLAPGEYRAGDVWVWFKNLRGLNEAQATVVWQELRRTFPELQDWVARRGHGGAAQFRTREVRADIAALRRDGVGIVVVQIHGGYQFADVASEVFRTSAQTAISAGADIVIGHHPHVLQGFEWYQGKLIAHSLGNFIFDQDFLATFPSLLLRAVFEGNTLLEARVYPAMIDRYRPVAVSGATAQKIIREVRADSGLSAPAGLVLGRVVTRIVDVPVAAAEHADLRPDGNSAVVGRPNQPRRIGLAVRSDGVASVPRGGLVSSSDLPGGTQIGRDLLRWGTFEDDTADGKQVGGLHWALDVARRASLVVLDKSAANRGLALTTARPRSAAIRTVARIARRPHRFHDRKGHPADGTATYSVRMRYHLTGTARPYLRVVLYDFDDTDPLKDPESTFLGSHNVGIPVKRDGLWHTVNVKLPERLFVRSAGREPNAFFVYLESPLGSLSSALIDDVQVLEWRVADALPRGLWLEADALVPPPGKTTVTVTLR